MRLHRYLWLAIVAAAPSLAAAQDGAAPAPTASEPAQTPLAGPPVQRIETASAVSRDVFGSINGVRELPDGRLLVNDGTRRRLLIMDTTLTTVGVALDSLAESSNGYGTRAGAMFAYRADSTLFVDPASLSVLVLDPAGKISRVRSVWRAQEVTYYTSTTGTNGYPAFDARGRLVYRLPVQSPFGPAIIRPVQGVTSFTYMSPDSALVIAVDPDTRKVDTLGVVRTPKMGILYRTSGTGALTSAFSMTNPLPSTDDWAVLADGTIAFVRARDYRVDYLNPDGTIASSVKLPYEWQRVTDEDKRRMVDSTRAAQYRQRATSFVTSVIQWVNRYNQKYPERLPIPQGYVPSPGFGRDWILPEGVTLPANYIYACAKDEQPTTVAPPPGATAAPVAPGAALPPGAPTGTPSCIPAPVVVAGGTIPTAPQMQPTAVIDPEHLPDYRPPLSVAGSVRADADGNLWIRPNPSRPAPGGLIYDVVNRQGELAQRFQLPMGYTIVGFGKGKVVYLSMRDASGIHLARVRLR